MAVKEVIMMGNPMLREISREINFKRDDVAPILQDLGDTLHHLQKEKGLGRALASPQLGYMKRMILMSVPDRDLVMINPVIRSRSDETFEVYDSCYSFDVAFFVKIRRSRSIVVDYRDINGNGITEEFSDDLSELFQHEIDHLDGILAVDHMRDPRDLIMREEWERMGRP